MPTTKTPSIQPDAPPSSSEQSPGSEERPRSMPPPPPSARPAHERPASLIPSPLPPPASSRLPVPSLPVAPSFAPTPVPEEVEQLEHEVSSLRKRLSNQRQETKVEHKNNEVLRNEIALLKTKLGRQATPNEAEVEAARARKKLEQDHRTKQQQAQGEIEALKAQLVSERGKQKAADAQFSHELERLREQLRVAQESNHVQELKSLKRELETLQRSNTSLEHRLTELTRERDSLRTELAQKEQQVTAPLADDLTRIKGIGPTFAKALNSAGVTTFATIAAWNEEDIEAIAPRIKTTSARIARNGWVQAAQALVASS